MHRIVYLLSETTILFTTKTSWKIVLLKLVFSDAFRGSSCFSFNYRSHFTCCFHFSEPKIIQKIFFCSNLNFHKICKNSFFSLVYHENFLFCWIGSRRECNGIYANFYNFWQGKGNLRLGYLIFSLIKRTLYFSMNER